MEINEVANKIWDVRLAGKTVASITMEKGMFEVQHYKYGRRVSQSYQYETFAAAYTAVQRTYEAY